ncbi:MAG: sugar transferase [Pseudomonadota bacterium]
MTPGKRLLDLSLALFLAVVLVIPMLLVALIVLIEDGRPIFYTSKRMKAPDQSFTLWKFRTMTVERARVSALGGDKVQRVTRVGAILRRTRLDELPQLYNILRGDMSFVGPRPPLRRYVILRRDVYAKVLQNRPGVTGLATLRYHRREEDLLAACTTAEKTDDVYINRCIPAKARLDLIWARNRSVCFDVMLLVQTVKYVVFTLMRKQPKNR